MTKTLLILTSIVLLYLTACSKKTADEPLPAPLQKLIAQDTGCICNPYLQKYTWRNQVVYMLGYASINCDWIPFYYDAAGEPLILPAGYTLTTFGAEMKPIKIVWSCGK
ncbi:MAG TPA: hypothetical protein VNS58_02870 [Puia sp.]|nr:hypothetical protein [Puia sp.]